MRTNLVLDTAGNDQCLRHRAQRWETERVLAKSDRAAGEIDHHLVSGDDRFFSGVDLTRHQLTQTRYQLPDIKHSFDLTEEERMVRDMVRDFAETELAPQAAEIDRTYIGGGDSSFERASLAAATLSA